MNLPRTAYILLWFPKASETFIFREAAGLWKMGFPLKVFTLYGKPGPGLSDEMQHLSDPVVRLGLSSLPKTFKGLNDWWKRDPLLTRQVLQKTLLNPWRGSEKTIENFWAAFCAFHLAQCFLEEDIHHIHAPWACGPATAAWVASLLTKIPFSFSARAWDINPPDGAIKAKTEAASFVRCESAHNRRYMARFNGGNADKIHVIHNPVTLKDVRRATVRMKQTCKLLAVGRLVEKKGFHHLINACGMLSGDGTAFHLKIAGDGPGKRRLKALARKRHVDRRVEFLGHIPHDRISNLMRNADIFLMPSQRAASGDIDGLPTVISEALLHSLPVIATDVAGISTLVENGKTGLLIPPKDPSAIARAVRQMAGDRTRAVEMAERGRLKTMEMYDSEKNNRALLNLIQNHAKTPSGRNRSDETHEK